MVQPCKTGFYFDLLPEVTSNQGLGGGGETKGGMSSSISGVTDQPINIQGRVVAISPYESHLDPRLFWPCPAAFNPLRPPIGDSPHAHVSQQPASAASASCHEERRQPDGKAEPRHSGASPLGRVPGVHGVAGLAFGGGRYR